MLNILMYFAGFTSGLPSSIRTNFVRISIISMHALLLRKVFNLVCFPSCHYIRFNLTERFPSFTGEEKFVSPNYVIENMDRHKGGTYICTANNGVGQTASSQIALHVLCKWKEVFKYFTRSSRWRLHPLPTRQKWITSREQWFQGAHNGNLWRAIVLDKWRLSHSPRDDIHNTSFVSTEASTAHTIHCPLRYCKYDEWRCLSRIKCVCQRRWAEQKGGILWQTNCFELNVFFFIARHKITFNLFTLTSLVQPLFGEGSFWGRLPSQLFLEVRLKIFCQPANCCEESRQTNSNF